MLKDRIVIITGAGRGIGKATALLCAQEGAKVVVSDIDPVPANETVEEITRAGGQAIAHFGNVMDDDFAKNLIKTAADTWKNVHIIVNNAGHTWDAMIHKMTDEQWETIIDLHLKAPFKIIRAAAPFFRDAAKKEIAEGNTITRKIINVSSLAGTGGNPGQVNYSSAKSGLIGLTKTIAKEWAKYNVQANAVAFGLMDTRLTQDKKNGDNIETKGKEVSLGIPNAQREAFNNMIPMGRFGKPEEAAGAILFFASPLSDYVSGQVLLVSGGLTM